MARQSTITQLAPEIRAECDRLIREGGYTIDELLVHLRELGAPIKRSALGEYKKKAEASLASYREAQEVAGQWVKDLGENSDSKTGQLLAELLKTLAMRTLINMQGQTDAEPQELSLLARTLKDLSGAQKADLEYRGKLREQWRAEMKERAAEAASEVETSAKAKGLSDVDAAKLRQMVLGVVS